MSLQSAIELNTLFGRQGRLVSLFHNALPQRVNQLDLFREWQLASVVNELRVQAGECNNKNAQKTSRIVG